MEAPTSPAFAYQIYGICVALSVVLMILFVFVNLPYYRLCYGARAVPILLYLKPERGSETDETEEPAESTSS